jgi:hypothetical protein
MFQHPLEDQFAPVALGFLPFQGAGQVGGFVTQAQVELLQALQLLGQREALAGFSLIAFFHAFFKGLDALLQRVEQLPQALLTGFGKTLFALIEDLSGQLGELRAQLVSRALQVVEALLMAFLLLAQLGVERGGLGIETTQFGFFWRVRGSRRGRHRGRRRVRSAAVRLHGARRPGRPAWRRWPGQDRDFIAAGIKLGVQPS